MPPRPNIPAKRPVAEAQEAAWVADEDRFVLQQAKKKAAIRAKSGRALPIDWLAVTLALVDPDGNPLDDELEDGDVDSLDPEGVFEGLNEEQLSELEKGVDTYITLESNRSNLDYWNVRWQPHALLLSSTNADRLIDDENNLPGPPETLQDGPIIRSRRLFRVGEHRQTACAQDPRGAPEARGTDQNQAIIERSNRHRLLGALAPELAYLQGTSQSSTSNTIDSGVSLGRPTQTAGR